MSDNITELRHLNHYIELHIKDKQTPRLKALHSYLHHLPRGICNLELKGACLYELHEEDFYELLSAVPNSVLKLSLPNPYFQHEKNTIIGFFQYQKFSVISSLFNPEIQSILYDLPEEIKLHIVSFLPSTIVHFKKGSKDKLSSTLLAKENELIIAHARHWTPHIKSPQCPTHWKGATIIFAAVLLSGTGLACLTMGSISTILVLASILMAPTIFQLGICGILAGAMATGLGLILGLEGYDVILREKRPREWTFLSQHPTPSLPPQISSARFFSPATKELLPLSTTIDLKSHIDISPQLEPR